ncbi:D-glucuronyl C5-epimerase domain-containing protein [Methanocaldococcus villosus KIN24-T80]|uniref:D-glucuronyl C5-epimerase domain-containing protein n=1 Tax=Methanocaldococcus villosus KIN24-T80 TaxID=1069083 RepID=N6VWZ9_9EURY|nr:hypothetical protein [Methanocaldococcus villosus]ENN95627.1 D-glucuronyl C5-epimerase domain-containing protein [Methanocaldococcus villosus KIN24-T80]
MLKNIKKYVLIFTVMLSLVLSFIFGYFIGISQITYSENPIIQYIKNPKPFTVENVNMPVTYYGTINGKYIGYQITPHNVNDEARKCFYKYLKLKNEDQEEAENYLKRGFIFNRISNISIRRRNR